MDEAEKRRLRRTQMEKTLAEMKALGQEIADAWTSEKSAVEFVEEQRAEDVPKC